MKNLTVNMPLAVPHQRPPSKYASHPYPLAFTGSCTQILILEDFTNRRILREALNLESLIAGILVSDFTNQSIVKRRSIDESYNQAFFVLEDFSKVTVSQGLAEGNDYMTANLTLESFTKRRILITTRINKSNNITGALNVLDFYKI